MAALSKVQKEAIKETAANWRHRKDVAVAAVEDKYKAAQAKLRDANEGRKYEAILGAGAGMGGAVIASQVHRELAVKRGRTGLALGLNLGAGVLGGAMMYYSKPAQSGMRIGGSALTGMAIAQVALSLQDKDLVPGMNG